MTQIAGWRNALRDDAADRSRWQAVARASEHVALASEPRAAAAAVLAIAADLLQVTDAAVLERAGEGVSVLAGRGGAKPPGARVIGAREWAAFDAHSAASAETLRSDGSAWRVAAAIGLASELHLSIRVPGRVLGALLLQLPAGLRVDGDSRRLLSVLAQLLAAPLLLQAGGARTRRPREDPRLARLTPRERQVLALLPRGYSNGRLGEELGITAGTAKTHVERILRKLDCHDRTQAAVLATQCGVAA